MIELWEELLGSPGIKLDDDFFELGGHSLLAARFIAAVQERCGVRLELSVNELQASLLHGVVNLELREKARHLPRQARSIERHLIFPAAAAGAGQQGVQTRESTAQRRMTIAQ